MVLMGQRGLLALLVPPALLGQMAQMVPRVLLVPLAPLVLLALLVSARVHVVWQQPL